MKSINEQALIEPEFKIETLEELESTFNTFISGEYPIQGEYNFEDMIVVFIQQPNLTKPELIMNPMINAKEKLDYYKKAYNDDLTLKSFTGIKIVGISFI